MAIAKTTTILPSTPYRDWIRTCSNCDQTFSGAGDNAPKKCPGCGTKW
jgi:rubrerythrin